jgi:hypothetical protein
MIPWIGDRSITRPQQTKDNTDRKRVQIYTHGTTGIRTYDPNIRIVEDSTCLRQILP